MRQPSDIREQIEPIAESLGATRSQVLKWRQRGIPGDWALRIVAAADGKVTVADMLHLDQQHAAAAPEVAA